MNEALQFYDAVSELPLHEIPARFARLGSSQRKAVLRAAPKLIRTADKQRRLAVAAAVASLLPASMLPLRAILRSRTSVRWYEVHFELLLVLDEQKPSPKWRKDVLRCLEEYLMSGRTDAGGTLWKAADTLGEHWPSPESVGILVRVLRQSKYAPARRAAAHALKLASKYAGRKERALVAEALYNAASNDRSRLVRAAARMTPSVRAGSPT